MLKHFDTFSGYGGFTIATSMNNINTIGFSEIDRYASAVLLYKFPNIKNYGDIDEIEIRRLPDFDILTGETPCQNLSVAGNREGLWGERSSLFFSFIKILCERLMGLSDNWTKYGNFDNKIKQISDTQRYKMCGNGVVIPVVNEIFKRMLK